MSDTEPAESDSNGEPPSDPSSLKGLTMAVGIEPADPDHDPIIGRDIGGVTIVRLIAEGGMGRVYEGLQGNPRRPVAVKLIRPGFVSSQVARRFSLETEILARLQHPFIAQIYSAGMCDIVGAKVPFFVMEFIPEAQSITRYARQKGLPTRERVALFRKACEAVAHGHHNGVIHRDLKPGNILVDRAGTPKVIDFGVARCIDAEAERITALTDMGQLIGTLQYMSPEQITADPSKIDVRSDVYALGVILYELLTNQRPYEISQQQIFEAMRVVQETKPVAPSSLNREVSPDVEAIAGRCLHKSKDQRFADAAALVSAIDRHLGGGPTGAIDPGWQSNVGEVFESAVPPTRPRRRPALVAVMVALVVAGVALAALWLMPGPLEWRFERAADMAAFETAGVVEQLPEGGVRLGDGVGYASLLTKQDFFPPLRVEYEVRAGRDRLFDIFPGLFVNPINTRTGIQYLLGDHANQESAVVVFGTRVPVAHEPIEADRLYSIVFEIDKARRLTITRDGVRVYEATLPEDAVLRGPVQCGGGYGNVTYERLSIGKPMGGRPGKAPAEPGKIVVAGIGESTSLAGEVPKGWLKPGVFAEIRGGGEARFPRLPESAYVLEMDVEMRDQRGCISFHIGEPGSGLRLALGSMWPQDADQDRVPSRLFRVQPWGVNWQGDAYFNPNEQLQLKLVVLDDNKALIWNRRVVLRQTGNVADFNLRLVASPETDATIRHLTCRAPTATDATEAGLLLPQRVLDYDLAATSDRLTELIADTADRRPEEGRDCAIPERQLVLRWIDPGEFVLGDVHAKLPQHGLGREKARIGQGYWLAAHEITQGQWEGVMKSNPSRITGSPYLPVNGVSWTEARQFCARLTKLEREADRCPAAYEYRLPTEAEWEWACLAGTDLVFTIPAADRPVRDRYRTLVEAGATPANPWGLHEMLGNVPEWCLDSWADYTGDVDTARVDRLGGSGSGKPPFVVRGGGIWHDESAATSFARTKRHDFPEGFRGFRVALAAISKPPLVEATEQGDRPLPEREKDGLRNGE